VGNAEDLAKRKRAADLQAVPGYDAAKVARLVNGLIRQMRESGGVSALEMIGVGDGIFVTVATTLLEVAAPGEAREGVRKELATILNRMRRDVETGPHGSNEVM